MKTKNSKGFSLIEILVALIIVSLIMAALSPIITKKLSSGSITLGSSSNVSDISANCQENENFSSHCELCTSQYCIKCGIEQCPSGQYLNNKTCTCMNCQEKFGANCTQCDSNACIQCINSNFYIKNGACTPCPSGSYCNGKDLYATCPTEDGYYCDSTGIHKCNEKYSSYCMTCNSSACTKCISNYFYNGSSCQKCTQLACKECISENYCTKCGEDWILNTATGTCSNRCIDVLTACNICTNASTCTSCTGDYFLNTSNTCTPCTIANCVQCSDGQASTNPVCEICFGGFYLSGNSCLSCKAKFGNECSSCNENSCLSCIEGYHVENNNSSNACTANDNKFECSDSNFIKIGKLCFTKRNMGDTAILKIPSTVIIAQASGADSCYSASEKCCWQGATSILCDSGNGSYSGCNRTVCNYSAAQEICNNFKFGGKNWRLPTKDEIYNLVAKNSIGIGDNGLMFCDHDSGYASAYCGYENTVCNGAVNNTCKVYISWLDKNYSHQIFRRTHLINQETALFNAYSVRCVSEM